MAQLGLTVQLHGLQQIRLPRPSLSPSNSCPQSQWCHPTISSSVTLLFSCPQSFPGSFPMCQLFKSDGQSIGHSVSAPTLLMNIQGRFPLGFTGLITLLSKGLSRVFSRPTVQKHQFFDPQPSLWSSSHICTWLMEKPYIPLIRQTFVSKVMSLLFNMLSRFVIPFLPRSKHLLISWLQSPSTVILESKNTKSLTVFIFLPIYLPWSDGTWYHDLSFLNVEFETSFFTPLFHLHQEVL